MSHLPCLSSKQWEWWGHRNTLKNLSASDYSWTTRTAGVKPRVSSRKWKDFISITSDCLLLTAEQEWSLRPAVSTFNGSLWVIIQKVWRPITFLVFSCFHFEAANRAALFMKHEYWPPCMQWMLGLCVVMNVCPLPRPCLSVLLKQGGPGAETNEVLCNPETVPWIIRELMPQPSSPNEPRDV